MDTAAGHESFMKKALLQAQRAAARDEAPIGAVVVRDGTIIARAYNRRECDKDPVGHAEILALRKAARKLGGWRLIDCDIYVTLEPCAMCTGAMVNARIRALYFGAYDPKAGACGSIMDVLGNTALNHKVRVMGGILEKPCGAILTRYFKQKRKG